MNIEEMTTEEAVKKYIQPFVVQKYLKTNINKTKTAEIQHYAELAGFSQESVDAFAEAEEQTANEVLHEAMETLKLNIVIKRPPFQNLEHTSDKILKKFWYHTNDIHRALLLPPKKESWTEKSFFGKLKAYYTLTPQFLAEVRPKNYIGKIPEAAVITAGKAVEANLVPRVWIAGTEHEIRESVRVQIDPVLVGYPIISRGNQQNNDYSFRNTHCLLLAAWGKDLDLIDNYFSKGES